MSYIGNSFTTQDFSPVVDHFNGTGSTTAFTLSRPVASVAEIQVVVGYSPQNPGVDFTVSGNTINFATAPASGTQNVYVYYTSPITQSTLPPQNSAIFSPQYFYINNGSPLGGATNPIVGMLGNTNNYIQSYIYNKNTGSSASSDFTAYPNNGTDASGWVDVGITSSGYSSTTFSVTGPNESYLFASAPSGASTTGNLVIATDSTGTENAIQFYVNGFNKAKSAYAMQIDKNNVVSVGGASVANNGILQVLGVMSLQTSLEKTTVVASQISGAINYDVSTQSVVYYNNASGPAGTWTMNFRGSGSLSLNSLLQVGQTVTVVLLVKQSSGGSSYYPTAFTIDGTSVAPVWQGGTAPTTGNANATDVYTFAILKTASSTFTVLASQVKFA